MSDQTPCLSYIASSPMLQLICSLDHVAYLIDNAFAEANAITNSRF